MINKLLGAAAMAAVILAVAPASAAKMAMGGCSGDNMMKTENSVEALPDGTPAKDTGRKEIVAAQTAMLDGKMGACASHIHQAMHATMMK
jgi:hypothetical protein